ncbi:hypothetical protein BaOVIS_000010 [Babesia ovis]|uniref:Uncharacterized protein n=1 Tax=Babesia ovis TaxID=5869 RepID=A0A9W5T7R3_BABOV|nr:hypothetical protein BaOVIS_000010 [Babesia ovis]
MIGVYQSGSSTTGGSATDLKKFKEALDVELRCCPGWRDPQCLMDALYNWRGGGNHKDGTGDCECAGKGCKGAPGGKHGEKDQCQCHNLVVCSGVLGLSK